MKGTIRLGLLTVLLWTLALSLLSCTLIYPRGAEYDGDFTLTQVVASAEWSKRHGHQVVEMDGDLYLIGGYSPFVSGRDSYMEDVWLSADNGVSWGLLTDSAPWSGRWGHGAVVVDNTIYISGGFFQAEDTDQRGYAKDVWKSTNGKDWELVTDSASWAGRMGHGFFANDQGDLYLLGGVRNSRDYLGDLWTSLDKGVTWTKVAPSGSLPFGSRGFAAMVEHEGALFLFGGSSERPSYGDSEDAKKLSTLFRWDMTTDEWSEFQAPQDAYRWKGGMEIMNNTLIILHGQSFESSEFYKETSTAVYTIEISELTGSAGAGGTGGAGGAESSESSSVSWNIDSKAAPGGPRYGYSSVSLGDRILLIGGQSGKGLQDDIWSLEE